MLAKREPNTTARCLSPKPISRINKQECVKTHTKQRNHPPDRPDNHLTGSTLRSGESGTSIRSALCFIWGHPPIYTGHVARHPAPQSREEHFWPSQAAQGVAYSPTLAKKREVLTQGDIFGPQGVHRATGSGDPSGSNNG